MTESNPDPSSRRGAWRRPVVVGIALLTGAVLVGLTAPTSGHPPQRIGITLVIGGAVLTA